MKIEILLKIGGIFNILCAVLHLLFPGMFKWNEILSSTRWQKPVSNAAIIYYELVLVYFLVNTGLHTNSALFRIIKTRYWKKPPCFNCNFLGNQTFYSSTRIYWNERSCIMGNEWNLAAWSYYFCNPTI